MANGPAARSDPNAVAARMVLNVMMENVLPSHHVRQACQENSPIHAKTPDDDLRADVQRVGQAENRLGQSVL
jgi:hypothetical protein